LKPHKEIISLAIKNVDFLISKKCKLIIIACNTATAIAIDTLRAKYNIPFIGMEPAVKPAALNTNTGKIGILATKGTFESELFKKTSEKYTSKVHSIIQIGNGLVELAEAGKTESTEAELLLEKYITPMVNANVDHIVLGCTHYPLFSPLIKRIIPSNIKLINPAPAVAKHTKTVLTNNNINSISKNPEYTFFSSGEKKILQNLLLQITNTLFEVNSAN
jgi:glutamate racemase